MSSLRHHIQSLTSCGSLHDECRSPGTIATADRTLEQRRLLLEQVEGRLRVQLDEFDGLERKATAVLAATGVTLGLVINNTGHFASAQLPVPAVFYGALVALAAALIIGVVAMWPRSVHVVPDVGPLLSLHARSTPEVTIGELVSTKASAYVLNQDAVGRKGRWVKFQMSLLALGGSLLVAAYILERIL